MLDMMAELSPTGGKPKAKKKSSSSSSRKRRSGRSVKNKAAKGKESAAQSTPEKEAPASTVGRMERTRRLLLAALKVWELKQRPRS